MLKTMRMFTVLCFIAAGIAAAQSYTTFFPPQYTFDYWSYCIDPYTGRIVYWCDLEMKTNYYYNTNGHYHWSVDQPSSTISCVDSVNQCSNLSPTRVVGNTATLGSIHQHIWTTRVGQAEKHTTTGPYGDDAVNDYVVGYNDIYWNDHPNIWYQVGGNTTGHGGNEFNHWMKSSPATALYNCTNEYLSQYGQQKICTNDMSLPFGGVFDIHRTWAPPHTFHDKGGSVDVPTSHANQCPANYKVPDSNRQWFLDRCIDEHGALPEWQNCGGSCLESNHIHFRWSVP